MRHSQIIEWAYSHIWASVSSPSCWWWSNQPNFIFRARVDPATDSARRGEGGRSVPGVYGEELPGELRKPDVAFIRDGQEWAVELQVSCLPGTKAA